MSVDTKHLLLLPFGAISYSILQTRFKSRQSNVQEQNFVKQQRGVFFGMALAMGCTIASFFSANKLFIVADQDENELLYTLKWFALPIGCLAFGIANIARKRFFSPLSITGKKTDELEMDLRYLTNTTEQLLLFLPIHAIIAFCYEGNSPYIICNTVLFTFGRILFWNGYLNSPNDPGKRALGFAATFYPSLLATGWTIFKLITSLYNLPL
eukprot:375550_1